MNNLQSQAKEYYNNGVQLYLSNLYDKALSKFEQAIDSDWLFFYAHLWKAKTLVKLKKYDESISYFKTHVETSSLPQKEDYTLQFCNTLVEEQQYLQALSIVNSEDVSFKGKHFLNYLFILLANGKTQKVIHKVLNLSRNNSDKNKTTSEGYQYMLSNKLLPSDIHNNLTKDNIVPRSVNSFNTYDVLKKLKNQFKEYTNALNELASLNRDIKENPNCNYASQLEHVNNTIQNIEAYLLNRGHQVLKRKDLKHAKKIHETLKNIHCKAKGLKEFEQKLKTLTKLKTRKNIKITALAVLGVFIFAIVGQQIHRSIQKSDFYDEVVKENDLEFYNMYLDRYGDDEKIHSLRENKLYDIALLSNNGDDINKLVSLYPKSKFLKTITLNVPNNKNTKISVFDANSKQSNISSLLEGKYAVPKGCTIGFSIRENDKIPVIKYLKVVQDLTINETIHKSKTVLFEDSFQNNTKSWNTFNQTKEVYGKERHQKVTIVNGNIELFNEYNNGFANTMAAVKNFNRNINFEIEAQIQRSGNDEGTFLLFGANKRAFNYVGFNDNGYYLYGYNNWDKSSENWIKQSGGWKYNRNISRGKNDSNTIRVTKNNDNVSYSINGTHIGSISLKKWYGSRIGFGVNNNTSALISSLKITQNHNTAKTNFIKDNIYYCWIDILNIRDKSKKGKIISAIKKGEPVKFLGGKGAKIVNVTFEGVYSPERYYEVELVDGTIGWVHGGALKGLKTDEAINLNAFKSDSLTISKPK